MKNHQIAFLVMASAALAACGGGSSTPEENPQEIIAVKPEIGTVSTLSPSVQAPDSPAPVIQTPVTPAPVTPAPVTPAPVTPAPVTPTPVIPPPVTPGSSLKVGAEAGPTLSAPEGGSTAAGNNGAEGLYQNFNGFAFAASNGDISIRENVGNIFGNITVNSVNAWMFNPGSKSVFITADEISGSGNVTPKTSLKGSYTVVGRDSTTAKQLDLRYSNANALAVTQASLAANWSSGGVTLNIDNFGAVTGTTNDAFLGTCILQGTALLRTPGSNKNLYNISLIASGSGCRLELNNAYEGMAGIDFVPAGNFVREGYYRALSFLVKTTNYSTFSAMPQRQR